MKMMRINKCSALNAEVLYGLLLVRLVARSRGDCALINGACSLVEASASISRMTVLPDAATRTVSRRRIPDVIDNYNLNKDDQILITSGIRIVLA